MPVAKGADAPAFEFDGVTFRPLAVPSRGTEELAVWRAELPPGRTGSAHTLTHEEVLLVIRGTVRGVIDGRTCEAGPGDVIIFPANTLGRIGNASDVAPAEFVCCTTAGVQGLIGDEKITPPWSV
ncbi:cupin domain-containing protein [Sphaerimonospora mesophila]|uniref:cupin domain-containing protein n=1 Tax=Sphaerimonospora mesophila TaxID=37483 RepID=UPI0006E2A9CB